MIQFIIVLQSSSKANETDYLSAAVSRYCKYVCNFGDLEYNSYVTKVADNCSEYVDSLLNCYEYLESVKDITTGFLLALNYQSKEKAIMYVESYYVLSLAEVLTNNNLVWKTRGELKTLIMMAMDWFFFKHVFANFRHGQKSDIVNSPLGLLKSYCDNMGFVINVLEKFDDIINASLQYLEDLQISINKNRQLNDLMKHNSRIENNIAYLNFVIDDLRQRLAAKPKIILDDTELSVAISKGIFELFSIISTYKD